jgi:hypothetical protein
MFGSRPSGPAHRTAPLLAGALVIAGLLLALWPQPLRAEQRPCSPRPCPLGGCQPTAGLAAAMPCCDQQPATPASGGAAVGVDATVLLSHPVGSAASTPRLAATQGREEPRPHRANLQPRGLYTVFASLLI